jgi:hypothetical protein
MPRTSASTLVLSMFLALTTSLSGCGSSYSGTTLTGIDIAPISPTIAVGATQQFTALGHDSRTGECSWCGAIEHYCFLRAGVEQRQRQHELDRALVGWCVAAQTDVG